MRPHASGYNILSFVWAAGFGVPGFFRPRFPPPWMRSFGGPGPTSFYDTSELKSTLEELVDFDLINNRKVRLSLGAVDVESGRSEYFDNHAIKIRPEHVMASGALPPAFPAIEIDGRAYWDGGIVSNTPLWYVFDNLGREHALILQVDLFNAEGPLPRNIDEVEERQKDIQYAPPAS